MTENQRIKIQDAALDLLEALGVRIDFDAPSHREAWEKFKKRLSGQTAKEGK